MTANDFHRDEPTIEHQPVQSGMYVLDLHEIAKIPELLARAKQLIESGVSSFHNAAEYLAAAQALGVSQRQLAEGVGKSAAWVNALLKWREHGYPDVTPFKNRRPLAKAVQQAEQSSWEPPDTGTSDQVQAAATEEPAETTKLDADTPVESEVAKRETVATPDATTTSQPKVKLSSAQRGLLVNTLGDLASGKRGVRDHAASAVGKQLIRLGLKWEDLIIPANKFEP